MIEIGVGRRPRSRVALARNLDAGLIAVLATGVFWLLLVVVALPQELVQDSWLALASGREVAEHGLPHVDSMTVWTAGREWVDQQWLGQLLYYGLASVGGVKAVLLTHALVLVAAVGIGLAAARRLGAAATSVVFVGVAVIGVAPWGLQMRTQDLGELFFVATLAILARDSQEASRRVYLVLPILAVWASVHGSVVLGALLVAMRALGLAVGRGANGRRALVLLAGAVLAPVASPYGFALVGYYKHLLANPLLHWFIDEWGASTLSTRTAIFYALAFLTIWSLARYGVRLTLFARLALILTLVSAVSSVRNIVWFGLCALVLLPRALDPYFERIEFTALARLTRPIGIAAAAAAVGAAGFAATRSDEWFLQRWPTAQASEIAALADRTPSRRIFADDRYADWLLWSEPRLRGRIAYDVRFELFSSGQIRKLSSYRNRIGDDWRAASDGYGLIVFDPALQEDVERGLLAESRFRVAARDSDLVVLARRRSTG